MADTTDVDARLRKALGSEFEIAESLMSDDADMVGTLGIDSLDMVDLAIVVQSEFGVKLSREEMVKAKTLGDLKTLIASKLNG